MKSVTIDFAINGKKENKIRSIEKSSEDFKFHPTKDIGYICLEENDIPSDLRECPVFPTDDLHDKDRGDFLIIGYPQINLMDPTFALSSAHLGYCCYVPQALGCRAVKMADTLSGTDCLLTVPDSISVAFLPDNATLTKKSQEKGLNYFSQGYIHAIKVHSRDNLSDIDAKCWRSMSKNQSPHTLHFTIDISAEKIVDSYCSCKAGLGGRCSHIIGLVKTLQGLKLHNFSHVPEQQSCTSLPQQWQIPRGNKISAIPINQVVVARPQTLSRKRKPILCQIDCDTRLPNLREDDIRVLQELEGTPLQYMLQTDAPTVPTPLGDVQLGSVLSYQTKNIKRRLPAASTTCAPIMFPTVSPVRLPTEYEDLNALYQVGDPGKVEEETRGQADSSLWKQMRSYRLTASNFGKVMTRRKKPTPSFLNSLFPKTTIHAVPLSYGKNNEVHAKKRYLEHNVSTHLHENGLVINNDFSFLGATPDGKVCCSEQQNGILEIKCPYTARNFTLEESWEKIPSFFLQKEENENLKLSKRHAHYAQVQGQLMITGAQFCEFVVYTKKDLYIERIFPDIEYMTCMLEKLCTFFRDHAKPYLDSQIVQ